MKTVSRKVLLVLGLLAAFVSAALLPARAADAPIPIVFVHGNGDTAALWTVQAWRFESNGYPRDRLFAIDIPYPNARNVDAVPQVGRSSTGEAMAALSSFVDKVRTETGAAKVALVGNSRGSTVIRNYLKNGGGAAKVSHAVLGGGVNHGVLVSDVILVGSEFNGASDFLVQLNAGPNEVVPGVKFLTLRSDFNDKFAQPDGALLGAPGFPTGISFDAPALRGATNRVLPGVDHREVSYGAAAFEETFRWIAGRVPHRVDILPEAAPALSGILTGVTDGVYNNLPVANALIEIWEVDPTTGKRLKDKADYRKRTGTDGAWGPFAASPIAYYEFVIRGGGLLETHIYRSPFPRSSSLVYLRPGIVVAGDETAGAVMEMTRPRGYFDLERDITRFDRKTPTDITPGVANVATTRVRLSDVENRLFSARFNDETIVIRAWARGGKAVSIAEFHY